MKIKKKLKKGIRRNLSNCRDQQVMIWFWVINFPNKNGQRCSACKEMINEERNPVDT